MTFYFWEKLPNSAYSTLDRLPWKCGKEASMDAILNSLEESFFKVTPRSDSDRYSLLTKIYKSKWRAEDKAPGIAPNHIKTDKRLLDLTERFDEADTAGRKQLLRKIQSWRGTCAGTKHAKCLTWNIWRNRKGKKMIQVNVRKKDLVGQHSIITSHIFLRSMKEKFHNAKKNWN